MSGVISSAMDLHEDIIYMEEDEQTYIKEECDSRSEEPSIAGVFLTTLDTKDDLSNDDVADLKILCRTCLSTNTIELSQSLATLYTLATGVSLSDGRWAGRLCRRCVGTVRLLGRFRQATLTADSMMKELLGNGVFNKSSINSIRKSCLDYYPKLVIRHNLPNIFDAQYKYNEAITQILNKETNFDEQKPEVYESEVKPVEVALDYTEHNNSDVDDSFEEEDLITLDRINPIAPKPIHKDVENSIDKITDKNHKKARRKTKLLKLNKILRKKKFENKQLSEKLRGKIKKRPLKQHGVNTQNGVEEQDGESNVQNDAEYVTRTYKKGKHKDDELFDEFFKCETLSLQQQKDEFARRKETANYSNSKMKCEFCFKGFMHERAYDAHMQKHSEKMGALTCKVCHRHCPTNKVLRKHMDHHKYKFSCKKCSYETKARSSAKLHIDWHNGKQYDCDKCGQIFTRISTLLSHARIKHPTDAVCGLCGYSFLGEKGVLFHTSLKHRLDNVTIPADGPQCAECDVTFANEEALFTHQRVSPRHGECKRNDAPPVPPKLKRQSKSKDGLPEAHRKETRGRRPLQSREPKNRRLPDYNSGTTAEPVHCEQCGVKMNSGTEYRVHFHKYHPNCTRTMFPRGSKPSLCDICGKMFKTPAILNDHMSEHTNLPAPYTCDECGKSFRKKSSLALHRNVHLGRRYPCPICGKCFNQVCNRDRHYTYVHSAVKDVKCDYCEKCFKSDEEKKLHTTYVHFKKPYPKRARARRGAGAGGWGGGAPPEGEGKAFCDVNVLGSS